MRRLPSLLLGLAVSSATAVAFAQQAPVRVDVEAQPLDKALNAWANQTGYQVLVPVERVARGRSAPDVKGNYTPEEALKLLLVSSTDLTYQFVNSRTVTIRVADTSTARDATSKDRGAAPLVLAQSRPRQTQEVAPSANVTSSANPSNRDPMVEVIVTAQKQSERLQDVPVPVSVVSAEQLLANNQLRISDYMANVPGLRMTPNAASTQMLSIRGISTGGGGGVNPTVGVTVDDVPYGSSFGLGGGQVVPDIDPGDLARIEVLRGPQGTLYGASSLGGLVKFVTVDPSTEKLSGRMQVGAVDLQNGDGIGYNVRGAVNVPLGDTFAIRASAFHRHDPGYIDDPILGIEGINAARADGGRVAALWKPADSLSLKFGVLAQQIEADGSSQVYTRPGLGNITVPLGDLQQSALRGSGGYFRRTEAASLNLAAQLANLELTSISGYNINSFHDSIDQSYALGGLMQPVFGVNGAPLLNDNKTKKFTQEVRLSGPLGSRIDWLAGVFYTDEESKYVQEFAAVDPATGTKVGTGFLSSFPTNYREYAGFADVTLHATEQFDVQFGARESHIRQTFTQTQTGPLVPALAGGETSPFVIPEFATTNNAFTYLVTPRLRLSPDLMVYARLASGYRTGGPNTGVGGAPLQYNPDRTLNYELGTKASFFDRLVSIDASVFYIDWKDIQLQVRTPNGLTSYIANVARAKSQGVELSVELHPVSGLTISTWGAWNDAELTRSFPTGSSANALSGDRLPNGARFSGNFGIDEQFPMTGPLNGFVGATYSYVGSREGIFRPDRNRQYLPSYAQVDFRAGVKLDTWTGNLFVNNLTDKRGVLTGGIGAIPPFAFTYIQPRTAGFTVTKTF